MDIKININDRRRKAISQPARQGRRFEWPTDPNRIEDDPQYILDICFYDGTTKPDPTDETHFAVVDYLQSFPAPTNDDLHTSSDTTLFHFYANANTVDPADISDDWDGTLPNRSYGIFERMPMTRITYSDFLENGEVLPVGASRPNFEVRLLYPETKGDAIVVDHKRIFRGGVQGCTADVLIDDSANTGYRCWSPSIATGHVKLAEKTLNSVFLHIGAAFDNDGAVLTDRAVSEIEGIVWLPFDTSDTDNYKVTETPEYTAAEYTEPVMKMIAQYTKLSIYTMPRRQWIWFHERSDGNEGNVTGWGIWTPRMPRDFVMPTPRKSGYWELAHAWDLDESGEPTGERPPDMVTVWNEDNAHARFTFVAGSGEADGEDLNGIFSLITSDPMSILGFLGGAVNEMWHVNWGPGGELTDPFLNCLFDNFEPLALASDWAPVYQGSYNKSTQFIRTMPDLKSPNLFGERVFHPITDDRGTYNGYNYVADYLRTVRAYQEAGFSDDGIAQREILYNHGLDAIAACGFPAPTSVQTWGVAVAGAKEGDLVAVIESGDGKPLYVWRKTDEEIEPSNNFTYPDPCNWYFARPDCSEFSGHRDWTNFVEVVNCRGIIEWPFVETKYGSYGDARWNFNRIIRAWGSWFDTVWPGTEENPAHVTPHRGTIALDPVVSVIAYFGIMPNRNAGGIHLG